MDKKMPEEILHKLYSDFINGYMEHEKLLIEFYDKYADGDESPVCQMAWAFVNARSVFDNDWPGGSTA